MMFPSHFAFARIVPAVLRARQLRAGIEQNRGLLLREDSRPVVSKYAARRSCPAYVADV